MKRVLIAALLAAALTAPGLTAQQTGDANRDYTVNGVGSGGTSYVSSVSFAPVLLSNVYSTQDTAAPVLWITGQNSAINWVPGLVANSVDVGPTGLTFLVDGSNPADPLSIFAATGPNGGWSLDVSVPGGVAGSTLDLACAHLTGASPDGFYISQTHRVSFVAGCNPNAVTQVHMDDGFVQATFNGWMATYYGTSYGSVFVGSNGFVTFGSGDTDFTETVSELLAGSPRIAMWWDDLDPASAGTVSFFDDAANQAFEVCFSSVPEFATGNSNNFNLRFEETLGMINITYGNMAALDGLVGTSPGSNIDPTGMAIDLSVGNNNITAGNAAYELFDGTTNVNDLGGSQISFVTDGPANGNNPILQL